MYPHSRSGAAVTIALAARGFSGRQASHRAATTHIAASLSLAPSRIRRPVTVALFVALVVSLAAGVMSPTSFVAAETSFSSSTAARLADAEIGSSAYQPIPPIRVADSRIGIGLAPFSGGETQQLSVVIREVRAAAALAPEEVVSAVVLNVTIVEAAAPGFVTVWPAGGARPNTSSVNSEYTGHTVANTVTAPVSTDGAVSLYSLGASHLVVDVQGVFIAAESATGGRLVSLAPVRALDTRQGGTPFGANETRVVDLRPYGVPESASAAVLNITLVAATAPGFLTVWPGGTMPNASNLNAQTGDVVANQVMVGMSNGQFSIYALAGGHLIVDVAGYFTGDSAAESSDGLFVPVTPSRLFDSRLPSSLSGGLKMSAGGIATLVPSNVPGIPVSDVGAVALNLTLAHTEGPGFATVWPSGDIPTVSSVNALRVEQVVANHVVASLDSGSFNVFTHMRTHVIADVFGYWTLAGAPGSGSGGTVTNPPTDGHGPTPPTTGPHAFLYKMGEYEDSAYARWNPCRLLDYQLNAASASPAQLAMLEQAIAAVEASTGLDMVQVGTTTEGLDGSPPAGARAVIVLASPSAAPLVRSGGYGGGTWSDGEVTSGVAMVSTTTPPTVFMNLLLHELGHMVGLDHVDDTTHVMNPMARGTVAYQNGDREGLWWIGAAQGCFATQHGTAADITTLDIPEQSFTVTCGGTSATPVFAGVEVFAIATPGHDDLTADASGHGVVDDEVCVRMPVPSR
jgi:hypothetical protein